MTHGTEEKIMDAALNEFAEKGYDGARTKDIAERSGLSEMTLFRRFKSKKNLFNQVIIKAKEDAIRDINLTLKNQNTNSEDYFKNITVQFWDLTEKYLQFLSIIIIERNKLSEDLIAELINYLIKIFEKNFPDSEVNPRVFIFSMLSFMFLSALDKSRGRNILDHRNDFESFMDYSIKCL